MTGNRNRSNRPADHSQQAGGSMTDTQPADRSAVLAELVDEAVVGLDGDGRITTANSRFAILTGRPHDELVGSPLERVLDGEGDRLAAVVRSLRTRPRGEQTTLSVELRAGDGETVACQFSLAVAAGSRRPAGATALVGTVRPVDTAEAELRRRASQQAAVATLGQLALEADSLDELMAEATRLVSETLGATHCKVLDLDADRETRLLRQGVGWRPGSVGNATVEATANSQAGYTLAVEGPVIVEDLDADTRFSGPELLTSHDVTSGISVCIGNTDDPWGILGVHDRRRRSFSQDDANFVQSMANALASAIDNNRRTAELETERTKLAALAEVNTVVREVTNAVLEQSTRQEIEQVVCESLAAFDSYRFAWIGEVDSRTEEIEPHVEAGTAGYLDEISISTDPTDPKSQGPAGRAVETQQLQVSQDVFVDPSFEPWRAVAAEWEYQSVAAIPITHEGTLYGVLGLYSQATDAFAPETQAIIEQLGEIVGHAIAAAERKQALMSDTVTELEVEITDVFTGLESLDAEIVLDHVVSAGGGTYLQYGHTHPETLSVLQTLSSTFDSWESVTVLSESATECRFEIQLSEPPIISTVAEHGGSITAAVISENDLRMTVQLPPTTNVRRLLSRLQTEYPTTRPIARRQRSRTETPTEQLSSAWSELLTDRQQASLEAAFFAGFFEWPRHSSGQDLAETMGVAPATFHQHLRAAERKLFGELLGGTEPELTAP